MSSSTKPGAYPGTTTGSRTRTLRFGRGFIIDADQTVAPPMFGYDAQRAIDKIYELLADLDGDGDVDLNDLAALLAVYGTGSE